MISYKDILYATTKKIRGHFGNDIDVITDKSEGTFENECFYVTIMPGSSKPSTYTTNEKKLIISVKYFNDDRIKNYEVADILSNLFDRNLKVKDRYVNISNVEPNFLEDEVGEMLDFLIYIEYFDKAYRQVEEFDNMQDVEITNKN